MKSNAEAFYWLQAGNSDAERREYAIGAKSPLLAMTDMIWSPPYQYDIMHSHNCMEIGVCIEGGGTVSIEGQAPQSVKPGTVIIIPEGARHSQQNDGVPITRWRYIAVDQRRLIEEAMPNCRQALSQLYASIHNGICLTDESMRSDVAWLISRMFDIKCRTAEESTAELEAILMVILMRVLRAAQIEEVFPEQDHKTKLKPVEPALLYIAEQYHTEIKIAQLARSCAMSESYFRKVFVQLTGETPVEYLNRYRIDRAAHMIRSSNGASVSHVAEQCGFTSIATFNRNFLRYTGQNPSEMKKKIAQEREFGGDKIVQNG